MKTYSKYLEFCEKLSITGKTLIVEIFSRDHTLLGYIKWFERWRQYAFFPESGMVFNSDCLFTIRAVVARLMQDRQPHCNNHIDVYNE